MVSILSVADIFGPIYNDVAMQIRGRIDLTCKEYFVGCWWDHVTHISSESFPPAIRPRLLQFHSRVTRIDFIAATSSPNDIKSSDEDEKDVDAEFSNSDKRQAAQVSNAAFLPIAVLVAPRITSLKLELHRKDEYPTEFLERIRCDRLVELDVLDCCSEGGWLYRSLSNSFQSLESLRVSFSHTSHANCLIPILCGSDFPRLQHASLFFEHSMDHNKKSLALDFCRARVSKLQSFDLGDSSYYWMIQQIISAAFNDAVIRGPLDFAKIRATCMRMFGLEPYKIRLNGKSLFANMSVYWLDATADSVLQTLEALRIPLISPDISGLTMNLGMFGSGKLFGEVEQRDLFFAKAFSAATDLAQTVGPDYVYQSVVLQEFVAKIGRSCERGYALPPPIPDGPLAVAVREFLNVTPRYISKLFDQPSLFRAAFDGSNPWWMSCLAKLSPREQQELTGQAHRTVYSTRELLVFIVSRLLESAEQEDTLHLVEFYNSVQNASKRSSNAEKAADLLSIIPDISKWREYQGKPAASEAEIGRFRVAIWKAMTARRYDKRSLLAAIRGLQKAGLDVPAELGPFMNKKSRAPPAGYTFGVDLTTLRSVLNDQEK